MYSTLPASIAILFLIFGFFALASQGINRVSSSFFILCFTTFFWQASWAVLFQVNDPEIALQVVKFGYFFILFLPTGIYHFLTEISGRYEERRYVYLSYLVAMILAVILLSSNLFISGHYHYFWGYYPKAGVLHPVHIIQTVIVVCRGLYMIYMAQKNASERIQVRLRFCLAGILIFFFAAVDYFCNYGAEFYPPGVIFIAITLGFFTIAIKKYNLFDPMALASVIAHEIRTPLFSIRIQASTISQYWPILLESYQLAIENNLIQERINKRGLDFLAKLSGEITNEVNKSNEIINMMLASASMENPEKIILEQCSIQSCIDEALVRYPFEAKERSKIQVSIEQDFNFLGSQTLFVFVLFNLLKNALYALKLAGKGHIQISVNTQKGCNTLVMTDTGSGIPHKALPHIFDSFYSTKHKTGGSGMGLYFCKKVMNTFKGKIKCKSSEGEYTTFILEFPPLAK